MSWIKNRWQTAALLMLAAAAIAVPAWGSSGGNDGAQRAVDPAGFDPGRVKPALAIAGGRDEIPLPPRPTREKLDQAIQCMADRGFGAPRGDGGFFISRSETETDEFQDAAKECKLPTPPKLPPRPSDAQIRNLVCGADRLRGNRHD
jgi:hypothetical protein